MDNDFKELINLPRVHRRQREFDPVLITISSEVLRVLVNHCLTSRKATLLVNSALTQAPFFGGEGKGETKERDDTNSFGKQRSDERWMSTDK
jgi:hypothetical protein